VVASVPVCAQTTSGTVTGTVHDSSGAVVPGASVLIRNHATSQTWESVTDTRGSFRLQLLPVGDYHLSVQLSGFTTATANLTLRVGDQIDVPIVLKPAELTEALTVEATLRPSMCGMPRSVMTTGKGCPSACASTKALMPAWPPFAVTIS